MSRMLRIIAFFYAILFTSNALAGDKQPASQPAAAATRPATATTQPAAVTSLAIYPPALKLEHQADHHRFVVMAMFADGVTRDVTDEATVSIDPPTVATAQDGVLVPASAGNAQLTAEWSGRQTSAPVTASNIEQPRAVSFRNDVIPVLTRAGCNSGACHGSAKGKNGFRLSLFGFEPAADYISLTREQRGRRVNLADPPSSLMLHKPLAEVDHEGGQRFERDSQLEEILIRWITANVPDDPADVPQLTGVKLMPSECVIRGQDQSQQLMLLATYSDGTDRDVTSLALFSSTDDSTAAVNGKGVVTSGLKGEAYVMARFGSYAVVSHFIVLEDGVAFAWHDDSPPANFIDEAINAKLKKLQVNPSPVCSDEVFCRRAYVDVLGVLPTVEEVTAFLADTAPDKRATLIDALLKRPEFPELWAMKWAEMLRIESTSRKISFKAMYLYSDWIRRALVENKPLDEMVRELLTDEGGNFSSPATNFYLVESDPTLIAENVAQVFCGIRIQCAQCHNHPFERWTQDDYYSFAAFFPQVGKKTAEDPRESIVYNRGGGEVKHLRTGAVMKPQFLGGPQPEIKPGKDRRAILAEWLTAKDNPYFASQFVDRVWAHFLGRGLVDPPDDVRVSNPPSHPQLRETLAAKFVESGYDLRQLVRWVCNTRTYQRSSQTIPSNERDTRNFSHAMVRRLPAEALLDAVCQVTGRPEKFKGLPLGARAAQVADGQTGSYFLDVFGRPARTSACTCERRDEPTLSQALHLINGQTLSEKISHKEGRLARLLDANEPPEQIIGDLYVAAYARRPTEAEQAALMKTLEGVEDNKQRRQILEDIYWAVLNSQEFVFHH